jgi:chromosome segregation ATPase
MILECASCAKMYRIRDDASPQPTKCPTCNGTLRAAGGAASGGASSRVKELETRIQSLERELADSRSGRPSLSVETSPGFSGFSAPVAELRTAAEKGDRLERDLLSLRSEMERKLKDKDREIAQGREAADREAAERRKQEARASGLEETHARALEGKEKTIQALDASIASYRSKVEALQKKLDAVEIQRLNDLNAFDSRIRQKEESDRVNLDRTTEMQQQALVALRVEMEVKIQEKDRLISEGRQALDREAGERRRLNEELNRLQENVGREVAEKQATNNALEATLSSYKSKIDTLQKRVDSLEALRRSEHDQLGRQLRASQAVRGRVDEASNLASDLDHSLDSIEASITTLRDRAQRLKASLEIGTAEDVAPVAPLMSSFVSPEEPEAEPARPVLSQADWGAPAPSPVQDTETMPAVEAEPEAAVDDAPAEEPDPERVELPSFSEVTKTKIKPAPQRHPDPDPAAEPAILENRPDIEPELELLPEESHGRVKEPTGVHPIVESHPAPTAAEETSDIPLISPPDDDKPAPPTPAKKEETKRKFSWQRK